MMEADLKLENIVARLKDYLNAYKIKLWLEPYHDNIAGIGAKEEEALQLLCQQAAEWLNLSPDECLASLKDLQTKALDRLKANQVFQDTGVASVKVRVTGEQPRVLSVNISLTSPAADLMNEVALGASVPCNRIKLISQGKVLEPTESLATQGVKNGSQLMAVVMADSSRIEESEKRFKTLETTKKDVKLLAGRSSSDNQFYFQVENQAGESLNLPYHERKALVTAMALHEKGRAALKKEDYPLALVIFLEADKEFSACTSELLKACDNYALLHLDIAWCYLCLRNPAQIPDAEQRLGLCEKNFHKSYGPNLERLVAIKGTTGNEAALFMRLHLLQGVVYFHQNRREEARRMLERAQSELGGLKVNDDSICLLMELGFTRAEALLGLRATHNNIEAAEELIQRKRKEKEAVQEKNRLQQQQDKERIKLGLCADKKQFCEPSLVEQLVAMGFDRRLSISALKLANNSVGEALSLIQEQPHLLPSCSHSFSEESVAQVVSLGVDPSVARRALERLPNLQEAVSSITALSDSSGNSELLAAARASALSLVQQMNDQRQKRSEEEVQAFKRVSEDLLDSDLSNNHLDLDLTQEEQFLVQYLSLLD